MNSDVLTSDQKKRLAFAQQGLSATVAKYQEIYKFDKTNPLICGAHRGVQALSLAEALWLNQKKWDIAEKTFILYHVDNVRNKNKKPNISLKDIGVIAGLTLTAAAAYCKNHHHLATMLATITVAKALCSTLDYVKDRAENKLTQKAFNNVAATNDNIKMAMRCLTPKMMYTY